MNLMPRFKVLTSQNQHGIRRDWFGLLCSLSLCGAAEAVATPSDIADPAGDVSHLQPPSERASYAASPPKAKMQTSHSNAASAEAGEAAEPHWDSFNESTGKGVANEITKGVRVEDILEPPADYRYASFGKQDPFIPPMMPENHLTGEKAKAPGTLEIPIVSALQRYALDSLSIVGIWQLSNGDRKAMVLTPAGEASGTQGVIVRSGDPIGNRGGRILAIGGDFLVAREFFLAPDGTRQYEDRRLLMTTPTAPPRPARLIFKPGDRDPKQVIDGAYNDLGLSSGSSQGPSSLENPGTSTGSGGSPPTTDAAGGSNSPLHSPSSAHSPGKTAGAANVDVPGTVLTEPVSPASPSTPSTASSPAEGGSFAPVPSASPVSLPPAGGASPTGA